MRILYYCPEYSSQKHGGSTHAREFLSALRRHPDVEKADIWPEAESSDEATEKPPQRVRVDGKLRQFTRCFKPRYQLTYDLCRVLDGGNYDSLIIRVAGHRNLLLKKIKDNFPSLSVFLEVNALRFQEEYSDIWFRKFWQKLEVRRFKYADRISVVSMNLKEYLLEKGVPVLKIMVNPNGVNETIFDAEKLADSKNKIRSSLGIPNDALVIGYVGGMESFRRLPEVVERIMAIAENANRELFLVLVGDGEDMPRVSAKIKQGGPRSESHVKLMGWVDYERVPYIMASFDIAIFPFTKTYCSPLKLFEYMALGLVTLAPRVPAVQELFVDNTHLRMIEQDGSNFEEVLNELTSSKEKCDRIAQSGKAYVLSQFTWQQNAERVVDTIKETIA